MRLRRPVGAGGDEAQGPAGVGLRRFGVAAVGVALVWGSLGAFGYIAGWQLHAHHASAALLGAQRSLAGRGHASVHARAAGCVVQATRTGQLAGVLEIPAIHLRAPVEEGTSDAVLATAVGHDPGSVWPGESGTAAFLAHDVSYFVHLGQLRTGDVVDYETACGTTRFVVTRSQVVSQGAAIPDMRVPTLVLDTCYPSNALFFTSHRLLVWATEEAGGASPSRRAAPHVPGADRVSYEVPAPPALVAQGLTLQQNEAPMGTMTLRGDPSARWVQSPGPLALESAALEAYFGGLHAAAQGHLSWWQAIAVPGLAEPTPLEGASVAGQGAPLDVTIDSTGGVPTEVVLSSVVDLTGGDAPGPYEETVTVTVHAGEARLAAWSLQAEGG